MPISASKLVLVPVPDTRPEARGSGVRRYRLARLALSAERGRADGPFSHLKRSYD